MPLPRNLMPTLITCPKCGLRGDLPDDQIDAVIGCPQCQTEFPARNAVTAPSLVDDQDGLAVWVGKGAPPATTPPPRGTLSPGVISGRGLPEEITPANAGAHLAWLRQEVGRFQGYVQVQLDVLRQRREDMARVESEAEAGFLQREHELNRERAAQAARAEELSRREEQLALREEDLGRRLAEADELEQTLRAELEEREAEVERQWRAADEATRMARSGGMTPPPVSAPVKRPAPAEAPDLLASWMA